MKNIHNDGRIFKYPENNVSQEFQQIKIKLIGTKAKLVGVFKIKKDNQVVFHGGINGSGRSNGEWIYFLYDIVDKNIN